MSNKKWQIKEKITQDFQNRFPEINPIVLQLLYNRGLETQEKIDEFLNPDWGEDLHDPFLFLEMKKAVRRTFQALEREEKIVIHGDYDADGVTGTVILANALKKLGAKNLDIYIPHRETEGYGLNKNTVRKLAQDKTNLIITVDCGFSNVEEIKLARDFKIDIIVTDHHHSLKEIPSAYAILNPVSESNYPFNGLSGTGVAFKLVQALFREEERRREGKRDTNHLPTSSLITFEKWLLDLVAIGTVADVSPLLGENRTLVKYGLIVLNKSRRPGLRELIKIAGLTKDKDFKAGICNFNLNTWNIAYQIGPRLNAASRMDHANTAYRLLTSSKEEEARELAQDLNKKNLERQKLMDEIYKKAKEQIGKVKKEDKSLIACGKNWPAGIIGLVAGKLSEEFYRPTLVIGKRDDEFIGSGRSIKEFNIIEALKKLSHCFIRYGGHSQACGFTIKGEEKFKEFKEKIKEITSKKLKAIHLVPSLGIDLEIKLKDADFQFYEIIEKFAPFGEANPCPLFLSWNLEIVGLENVGLDGKHLRIIVKEEGSPKIYKMISFGKGNTWGEKLKIGEKIDVVFEIGAHEWNGTTELEFKVMDLKLRQQTTNNK